MTRSKTRGITDHKKQYTIPCTSDVLTLVTSITNKYARAVVKLHPTDDEGPMDAGISDSALLHSALQALDERLDAEKPEEIVEFIDPFKKKRGPQGDREGELETNSPLPKRAVKAAGINSSTKRNLVLSGT